MSPENLIEVSRLKAGFGDIKVLRGIDLNLKDKGRIGIFGPNGHGKTTLLEVLSGLVKPWSGEVLYQGKGILRSSAREIVAAGLVHVPQGNVLFPRMTVWENLSAGAFLKPARARMKQNLDKVLTLFPRLAERRNQKASTLSGGERQMLAIGAGIMAQGRVMMLDEPTLGLSPLIRQELSRAIDMITREGVAMILVEQDFNFMSALVDRVYMIEEGRVVFQDRPQAVDLEKISRMYFGGGGAEAC